MREAAPRRAINHEKLLWSPSPSSSTIEKIQKKRMRSCPDLSALFCFLGGRLRRIDYLLLALEFFEVLFPQLFVIVGCDSLDQLLLFECELSDLV